MQGSTNTQTPAADTSGCVQYTTQTKTAEEKTTARTNIAAASTDVATTTADGLMSTTDKTKLDGIINVTTGLEVPTTAWTDDTTFTDYTKKAAITVSGALATHTPIVTFAMTEATSGNYAPVATTAAGTVTIYAKTAPTAAITLQSIILIP